MIARPGSECREAFASDCSRIFHDAAGSARVAAVAGQLLGPRLESGLTGHFPQLAVERAHDDVLADRLPPRECRSELNGIISTQTVVLV